MPSPADRSSGAAWLPRAAVLRLVVGVAMLVVAAGWWLSVSFASGPDVSWVVAEIDDLVIGVDVEGTLASRDSSQIGPPQVPGFYDFTIRFMAPEGSEVEQSSEVLKFDTSNMDSRLLQLQTEAEEAHKNIEKLDGDTQQQLMTLELQLAEAEANLSKARLQNDVPAELRSANQAEIDRLDLGVAEVEVRSLQGRLEAANTAAAARRAALVAQRDRAVLLVAETTTAIKSLTVTSPRAGTVIYSSNWRGEKKKVGDSVWRDDSIIEIPNLALMMGQGEVDEADAGRLQEGQSVVLRLDAHPDIRYRARIESMAMTVRRKRRSRNPLKVMRLDLALDDTDTERMRPGMRFRGTVEAERIGDVLVIPAHAVFPSDSGPVVYRQALFGHERVRVELGARNAFAVHVLSGLAAGDRVAETRPDA
ncbi:MAG TPA: HlyD family efflux transporter periplasmic adaptor subunit [Acidobacteriota bacterium]|nr:HlyD family efflux transporter periplasmic adaptor subunit [Acidobacteriota bacterium]